MDGQDDDTTSYNSTGGNCLELEGLIYSNGSIWLNHFQLPMLSYISLQIMILSLFPRFVHFVLKRLKQPLFVSYLLGGILIGPSVLGRIQYFPEKLFPVYGHSVLDTIAMFGSTFYLFKVGVKMDPTMLIKTGKKAWAIGFLCYVLSFQFGFARAHFADLRYDDDDGHEFGVNESTRQVITLISTTSFPVIACALTDLKILNSELGRLALSASMVTDLLQFTTQAISLMMKLTLSSKGKALYFIISLMAFVIIVSFMVRPASLWVIRRTPEGKPVQETYITCIFLAVLLCALTGEVIGQRSTMGAFILGLAIPDGPPLGSILVEKLDDLVIGLFMPLLLAIIGLKTDVFGLQVEDFWKAQSIIIFCFTGKFIGVVVASLCSKIPLREASLLGLIMNFKGIIELSMLNAWISAKQIDEKTGTVAVLNILLIAAIVTPLIQHLYDPSKRYLRYKKRSIVLYTKQNYDQLRILICIQDQEDVPPILRLLETKSPSQQNPHYVFVLHLVELVGRAAPLLITHLQQKSTASSELTKTERINNAFRQFEQQNKGSVYMSLFSTISPYISMHNDIFTLSVDMRASIIIFPFHINHAPIEGISDNYTSAKTNSLKVLVKNLLDSAPCSVGLLVGHHSQRPLTFATSTTSVSTSTEPSIYRVAMFFFGGADDREALAYAMLMLEHPFVSLTVVHFVAPKDSSKEASTFGFFEEEKIFDDEVLNDLKFNKMNCHKGSHYQEEMVTGPEDTVYVIKTMKDDFDLFIVGKRQKGHSNFLKGLDAWKECEELGIIGDMLASPDFQTQGSVLVVKQHQEV